MRYSFILEYLLQRHQILDGARQSKQGHQGQAAQDDTLTDGHGNLQYRADLVHLKAVLGIFGGPFQHINGKTCGADIRNILCHSDNLRIFRYGTHQAAFNVAVGKGGAGTAQKVNPNGGECQQFLNAEQGHIQSTQNNLNKHKQCDDQGKCRADILADLAHHIHDLQANGSDSFHAQPPLNVRSLWG